jgi:hypothetical protein
MMMLAHIVVCLAGNVIGASAHQRWQGMQHIKSDTGFMSNGWVKLAMLIVLVGSVLAFVAVTLFKKYNERKTAEKEFAEGVARKGLTPAQTDTLIEIAIKAGLKRIADIFILSDAFEAGLDILFKGSFVDGNPTNKTVELERQLADLKTKMNFRKVARGGGYHPDSSYDKSPIVRPADSAIGKTAFVAIFKDKSEQGDSPPVLRVSLSEFLPATVTGLVGRVLFIETMLPANVGDSVIVVIGSGIGGPGSGTSESIKNIGTVEQSVEPAEALNTPNTHRFGVNFADLSEVQMAKLAEAINGANGRGAAEQVAEAGPSLRSVSKAVAK